jgi:signal transduction histidine kinase/DNA-binding response OmpR family regulator
MADYERLWGVRVLGIAADRDALCSDGSFSPDAGGLSGALCLTAASTGTAMEMVSDLSQRPHVAVVDLGSKTDGFDVCGIAGQMTEGFSIPVLFAMGRSDVVHMNEAIAARPAGYLHKPVTAEALRKAIADLVPERSRPVPEPMNPAPAKPESDVEKVATSLPPTAAEEKAQAPASPLPPEAPASAPQASPLPPKTPTAPMADAEEKAQASNDSPEEKTASPPPSLNTVPPAPPAPVKKVELPAPSAKKPLPVITKLQAPVPESPAVESLADPAEEPEQEPSVRSSPAADVQALAGTGSMTQDTAHLHPSAGSTAGVDWQREMRGQQLQGLGLLGRGFAHEFNNLLTVLIGNLSLAQDRYESGENADPDSELATAQSAADRARRMVQQLLTFAEGGRPVRDSVRIADVARTVLMSHRKTHPSIRFQFQCSEPDLRVSVDRDQVSRLLENLVTNAVQAMTDGGTLIVRLFTATDAEIDRIRPGAGQSGLEYLLVEVIDTGVGMDEDTLKHAFDPYFTTRSEINATGIGLTVCESIAKAHGGFLVLQSKPGRGTIATFHLPMNAATARPDIFEMRDEDGEGIPGLFAEAGGETATTPAAAVSAASLIAEEIGDGDEFAEVGGGRRVLVMEDDAMIRRLVSRCLGRAGYDVVETTNGQDALDMHEVAKAENRAFDLILSDLTIEDGMGGIEMMKELRQRDPDTPAIVSSGYADSPAMATPDEYGFDAVLPKPYPPRELLRLVAAVLGVGVKG